MKTTKCAIERTKTENIREASRCIHRSSISNILIHSCYLWFHLYPLYCKVFSNLYKNKLTSKPFGIQSFHTQSTVFVFYPLRSLFYFVLTLCIQHYMRSVCKSLYYFFIILYTNCLDFTNCF